MRTKTKTRVFSPLPKVSRLAASTCFTKESSQGMLVSREYKDPWSFEDLNNTSSEYGLTRILTIESHLRTKMKGNRGPIL